MDIHDGIMVKVLLNSSIIGIFMDRRMTAMHGLKLQKLERPIIVRNIDGTNNSGGAM